MKNGSRLIAFSIRCVVMVFGVLLVFQGLAYAGTWQRLNNLPPNFVSGPILLTDGTIMFQQVHSNGPRDRVMVEAYPGHFWYLSQWNMDPTGYHAKWICA